MSLVAKEVFLGSKICCENNFFCEPIAGNLRYDNNVSIRSLARRKA